MNNCKLPEGMRINEKCLETGCESCGWNKSVAKKRKEYMKTLGLTTDTDGLQRLEIMPRCKYIKIIHNYVMELLNRLEEELEESYHAVDEENEYSFCELKTILIELEDLIKAITNRNLLMIIKLAIKRSKEEIPEKENGQESKSDIAG